MNKKGLPTICDEDVRLKAVLTSFTMSCKCKCVNLLLSQKLEFQVTSEKVSHTELSQWLGCSQSTISKILSQNDELKDDTR